MRWVAAPSVSTIRFCSGQWKSTSWPLMMAVDERTWQSVGIEERQHRLLEVGAGDVRVADGELCKRGAQVARRALGGDRVHVDQAQVRGAVADASELVRREDGREVGQRARHRGARQAVVVDDDVARRERAGSRAPGCPHRRAAAQRRDVDPAGWRVHQVVQRGGGPVAQRRGVRTAARQDRRPAAALEAQRRRATGVNPAIKGCSHPRLTRLAIEPRPTPAALSCAVAITPCWRLASADTPESPTGTRTASYTMRFSSHPPENAPASTPTPSPAGVPPHNWHTPVAIASRTTQAPPAPPRRRPPDPGRSGARPRRARATSRGSAPRRARPASAR